MSLRPIGLLMQDNLENQNYEEKQMTGQIKLQTGASSASTNWNSINWETIDRNVYRLQVRIAKATREGHQGRAKALQWIS